MQFSEHCTGIAIVWPPSQ